MVISLGLPGLKNKMAPEDEVAKATRPDYNLEVSSSHVKRRSLVSARSWLMLVVVVDGISLVCGFGPEISSASIPRAWQAPQLLRFPLNKGVPMDAGSVSGLACAHRKRRRGLASFLTMQRPPEHMLPGSRSRSSALTAMGMTMTRSKRPGGGGDNEGKDRIRDFTDEVGIVAAGAVIGGVTGLFVLLFKVAISRTRDFTYEGAWGSVIDSMKEVLKQANLLPGFLLGDMPPLINAELLSSLPSNPNFELALYPLLGGIITTGLLLGLKYTIGGDFGPPLSGQLEELQLSKPPNVSRFAARTAAATATLGTGCSLGPEGPSVEIGVTVSRVVSGILGICASEAKVLAAAGAAAGVSAGFNAPLTGVVFALEILLPSLNAAEIANAKKFADSARKVASTTLLRSQAKAERRDAAALMNEEAVTLEAFNANNVQSERSAVSKATAGSVLTSAAIACLVIRSGMAPVASERFSVADVSLVNTFTELPFYMTLGILTGGVAAAFRWLSAEAKSFYAGKTRGFEFMGEVPPSLRPMLGASLCGVVASKYPGVLFFGYDIVNGILKESSPFVGDVSTLLTLLFLKVSLTASCVGSGLMGGVFAPSLFFGATLGAAYDGVLHSSLGLDFGSSSSYASVGAAAVLASVFRAPVTGILLMFELTRNYDIALPLIATVATGTLTIDLIEYSNVDPTWGWWWAPAVDVDAKPPPQATRARAEEFVAADAQDGGAGKADTATETETETVVR